MNKNPYFLEEAVDINDIDSADKTTKSVSLEDNKDVSTQEDTTVADSEDNPKK